MSTEQQSEKTAEEYFKDGLAFSKLGDDRRTFESYKKAIELKPDYAKAYRYQIWKAAYEPGSCKGLS